MAQGSLSFSATVILQAIANGYPYGFDIMDVTGLPSGTGCPALRRLESNGYTQSKWEKAATAEKELRPPPYSAMCSNPFCLIFRVEPNTDPGLVSVDCSTDY
jgi:hypothetical protein